MRALGVDLGSRRIGLAVCDSGGLIAVPLQVLERSGSEVSDHAAIAELVAERKIQFVVVGLPLSLNGTLGSAAREVVEEVARLQKVLDVPVETQDERLSTVAAERSLASGSLDGKRKRQVVDMVAATILLQSWLDSRSHRNLPQN